MGWENHDFWTIIVLAGVFWVFASAIKGLARECDELRGRIDLLEKQQRRQASPGPLDEFWRGRPAFEGSSAETGQRSAG